MHDDERIALESAILRLSDAVIKLHDWRNCYLRKIHREDMCIPCFTLKTTSFIRAGINAKIGEEKRAMISRSSTALTRPS